MQIAREELKNLKAPPKNPDEPILRDEECDGVALKSVVEVCRIVEGFHEVFGLVLDRLRLSSFFTGYRYEQLKDVIVARIADPSSKLQTAHVLTANFGRPITENRIYRLMDEVAKHKAEIDLNIFSFSKSLSENQKIDLLLFDVTTLYFESQKPDEVRDFGYSKDHKIGEVQVVLALATTTMGLPIGYHLFSGKTAEVGTLMECLESWKKIFEIGRVTVVADRAMMSDANLLAMEEANIEYIIAAKLRGLPKALQKQILERKAERAIDVHGESVWIQEQEYKNRRLVIGFSQSRADKDRGDRDRLIARLEGKLGKADALKTKKLITNRGYLKFTDEKKVGSVCLNKEKISEDALWDGLHGVITNNRKLAPNDLLMRYRRLWVIEESFRINKHTLAMRPIYHFSPKRIRSHVLLCYIAFAVSRYLQHYVKAFDESLSIEKIREALFSVQASLLKHKETDSLYRVPSESTEEAKIIYKALSLRRSRRPSKVITKRKCSASKKMQPIDF